MKRQVWWKMKECIKQNQKPGPMHELYQSIPARNFSEWSYTQGRQQECQHPVTGKVGDKLDGIHSEITHIGIVGQLRERDKTDEENEGL